VTARWGTGNRIPQTPWVATRAMRTFFFNPQSLRDSPCGALGTGFPRPLGSLRALCARFFQPPVTS